MSYQLKVLKDHPVGFWPLDELYSSTYSALSYNDSGLLYNQSVFYNSGGQLTEYPSDRSGCGNDGLYKGSFPLNDYIAPLISGGQYGTNITNNGWIEFPINKDYYGSTTSGGFGNKNTSDNDFSLELWIFPKITTTNFTTIFADITNNIGIYWDKGNIVFKIDSYRLDYTVKNYLESIHVVATYSKEQIALYVNGKIVSFQSLSNFKFTNSSLLLQIGPTSNSSDSFIVDAPAVYRYKLSAESIIDHYQFAAPLPPTQISNADEGKFFILSDKNIRKSFSRLYPINKKWNTFYNAELYYDKVSDYISLKSTSTVTAKEVVLYDSFTIPNEIGLVSSKIEWDGTTYWDATYGGLKIETSTDNSTWVQCENGKAIPQYKLSTNSFSSTGEIYLKITLKTTDASKYIPKLYSLNLYFYTNKKVFSENSGDYIEPVQPTSGTIDLTVWDYDLASIGSHVISRNQNNGIRPYAAGFALNTLDNVQSVEMIFNPINTNSENYLIYAGTNHYYYWNASGAITKGSAISAVYVNGIDRTSATNISSFLTAGENYHIVIVFSSTFTTRAWFNVKVSSNSWTNGGSRHLYSYITTYKKAITLAVALDHYNTYIGFPKSSITDQSFSVTENNLYIYNRDWQVIKSI